mmetsp:Transcript_9117/g.18931  ORF Transcript_9117/g.18931 Transcript_9117/m.18931 type:complete len:83 (-) Transcript_9117:23-271(-)
MVVTLFIKVVSYKICAELNDIRSAQFSKTCKLEKTGVGGRILLESHHICLSSHEAKPLQAMQVNNPQVFSTRKSKPNAMKVS